jgi:aminopeptidase-like protein
MVEKCKKEIVRQIKSIESRFLSLPLNLSPDVEMVSGEKEVLDLLNKHKRQTKEEYCAMWITDEYDRETLNKYYLEENKLEINNITRLIDIKKIEKERIREHIMMFKDDICSGRYSLFSTLNGDYEIALCQKNRKKNDVTAILMFPDNLNNKVDLAIYSNAPSFVDAIRIRFRDFQQKGKRFRIIKNDIDKSIDDWILQTERGYGNG